MKQCDACRKLTLMPHRSDVPPHLQLDLARALSFGFVRVTTYECIRCESLWRWRVTDGWEQAEFSGSPIAAQKMSPEMNEPLA